MCFSSQKKTENNCNLSSFLKFLAMVFQSRIAKRVGILLTYYSCKYCWWFRNPKKNHLGCKKNKIHVNNGINLQTSTAGFQLSNRIASRKVAEVWQTFFPRPPLTRPVNQTRPIENVLLFSRQISSRPTRRLVTPV